MLSIAATRVGEALERQFDQIRPPELQLRVRATFIGAARVQAVLVTASGEKVSRTVNEIFLLANHGVQGDAHAGPQAVVDKREDVLHRVMGLQRGTPMANLRQVSIVDVGEGSYVARLMSLGVDEMPPGLQAENFILSAVESPGEGIFGVSDLPPRTLITFFSPEGELRTASLHVIAPNAPCGLPHANIVKHFPAVRPRTTYTTAAEGKRGVVAMVKTSGIVECDDLALIWQHN